jgi:hypothetical protein
MKIRPVEAELFHADRQTDGRTDRHGKANSRFSQFCERARIVKPSVHFVTFSKHLQLTLEHDSSRSHAFQSTIRCHPTI